MSVNTADVFQYANGDIEITRRLFDTMTRYDKMYRAPNFLDFHIKKVIFNPPATVVYWQDGSKTVAKCMPGDEFDPEKGIAMAIVRKVSERDPAIRKDIKNWVKEYVPPKKDENVIENQ